MISSSESHGTHDPKLAEALLTIKARLEALPEQLRGPFIVKGLAPYLAARPAPPDLEYAGLVEGAERVFRTEPDRTYYADHPSIVGGRLINAVRTLQDRALAAESNLAEMAKMAEALKPFANWPMGEGERDSDVYLGSTKGNVTYGDFRRAREFFRTSQEGDKP